MLEYHLQTNVVLNQQRDQTACNVSQNTNSTLTIRHLDQIPDDLDNW